MLTFQNYGPAPFQGWLRAMTDYPFPPGELGPFRIVNAREQSVVCRVGAAFGADLREVHGYVHLQPGDIQRFDLDARVAVDQLDAVLPPERFQPFAMPLLFRPLSASYLGNGEALHLMSSGVNGAYLTAHYRCRLPTGDGPFVADVHLQWAPEEVYIEGRCTITCSDPRRAEVLASLPTLRLDAGEGVQVVPFMRAAADPLIEAAEFADGQARIVPFLLVDATQAAPQRAWVAAVLRAQWSVHGYGLDKLYPEGNPRVAMGASGNGWQMSNWIHNANAVHSWDASAELGVHKRSLNTGSQEDQLVHGEVTSGHGLMAMLPNYLSALCHAKRPCHHREVSGVIVDERQHPQLMLWHGRPHFAAPDHLGKTSALPDPGDGVDLSHGWFGPDQEHWLVGRLFEATRMTNDPALQLELEHHAHLYLLSSTLPDRPWFTSGVGAARAVGYKGILVHRLWHALANRELADRVRERWWQVLAQILLPALETRDIWDIRTDVPSLGPGDWWMPWQQAVGAYGAWLACTLPGDAQLAARGKAMAQLAAEAVLRDGYVRQPDGSWHTRPIKPVRGGGLATPDFNFFGMALAPATILSNNPTHATASEVWRFLHEQAIAPSQLSWLVPVPGVTITAGLSPISKPRLL